MRPLEAFGNSNEAYRTWTDRASAARGIQIGLEIEREVDGRILIEIPRLGTRAGRGTSVQEALGEALNEAMPQLAQRLSGALEAQLHLQIGKCYRARNGSEWLCFSIDPEAPRWRQASCVRVGEGLARAFFIDGRHEESGTDEFTLIEEVR